MLNNQTIQSLREMRLPGMADAYARQLQNPQLAELPFEERFGMLVDAEMTARQNHRLTRLLREARLKVHANPEDIDYHQARGVDQGLLRSLTTGQWITAHHNLILTGPTGIGKTFIACALRYSGLSSRHACALPSTLAITARHRHRERRRFLSRESSMHYSK